jgi:DNA-3-methyladenine glycosylase
VILPRVFYARPTLDVARDLIGTVLVHEQAGLRTSGVIVETEAYIGESDPACHAAPGPTARNAPLYGPPGFAYVYLNYGIHYLVNAVTEPEGSPAAVLIRALEPLEGETIMRRRRARGTTRRARDFAAVELCRGPGNLARALGITLKENRLDLTSSPLRIEDQGLAARPVAWGPRVGLNVGVEHAWRCYAAGSPAVSAFKAGTKQHARTGEPGNRGMRTLRSESHD